MRTTSKTILTAAGIVFSMLLVLIIYLTLDGTNRNIAFITIPIMGFISVFIASRTKKKD